MPVKIGKKKYKNWKAAATSLQKSQGYSKETANKVVATIEKRKKAKTKKKKKKTSK